MMNSLISWFSNADNVLAVVQVFAAFVTALATLALWRVTKVLAVETAELASMTSRPFVVGSLESSPASALALNLTLRNTGNATAFDIELTVSPALPKANGTRNPLLNQTERKVSLLPPTQALTLQGVMGSNIHDEVYQMKVSWADKPGSEVRESLSYSIEAQDGFNGGWSDKNVHHVADELKKIREALPKT
jgi:hypothetical protein